MYGPSKYVKLQVVAKYNRFLVCLLCSFNTVPFSFAFSSLSLVFSLLCLISFGMGCGASKESLSALPPPGISVIHGQQAKKQAVLKFRKLKARECTKLRISADSLEVKSGGRRRYIVARQVHGVHANAFRQQQIRDADGHQVLCLIAMDWAMNATNCNCYGPTSRSPKVMRKLFTLKRGDRNNFWAEINDPHVSKGNTTQILDVPLRSGVLRYDGHNIGRIKEHKLIVESCMDQIMVVALVLMTTEIRRLGLYTKMLMYSKPTPDINQTGFKSIDDKYFEDSRRSQKRKVSINDYDSGYSSRASAGSSTKRLYTGFRVRKNIWNRPQSVSSIIDSYSGDTMQHHKKYYSRERLCSSNKHDFLTTNKIG
jgi:hypothetical protein